MITVLEAIKLSTEYLDKKGVESARANAEILLAEILKCKRLELYLSFDKPLNEDELNQYREFIRQRGLRIPLQYIVGYVEFYGFKFMVDKNVLIPRPETELLVEQIINNESQKENLRILDIGVGSGNISISLLKHLKNAKVVGIDISESALNIAKQNADKNGVTNQLDLILFNVLSDDLTQLNKFDIIVTNPPYVNLNDYNDLEPELKNYEPRKALTDESNGFTFYKKIIESSKILLDANDKIYFELGKDQHEDVKKMMIENDLKNIKIVKDYAGIKRIIYGEI